MALPEFQHPDLLGAYLRGVQAPGQLRAQQQGVAMGDIQLQQAQMGLAQQQAMFPFQQSIMRSAIQELGGQNTGSPGNPQSQPQANMGGPTGGIQNGPQGAVSAVPPRDAAPSSTSSYDGDQTAPGGLNWTDPTGPKTTSPQLLRAMMLGGGPMAEMAKGLMQTDEAAQKKAQLNAQGPLDTIDKIFNDPHPASIVLAPGNDGLLQRWRQFAPQLGIDPRNPQNLTDANVRRALAFAGNQIRGTVGMAAKEYPNQAQQVAGAYGQSFDVDIFGNRKEITPQKLPTYEIKDTGTDLVTGKKTSQAFMTSPGGAPAPGVSSAPGQGPSPMLRTAVGLPAARSAASGGPAGGGVGSAVGPKIDSGYPAPTPADIKQVGYAATMQSGLQTVRGLETKGFSLSPSQRTALIEVATKDDIGSIHQLALQEGLRHMSDDAQTYVAGMVPIIQAVSHDQGGQRLSQSQVRLNLEGVIPLNVKNPQSMAMIEKTRENWQNVMNLGSGSAAYTPEFAKTVGAQRDAVGAAASAGKTVTQSQVQDYATKHNLTVSAALAHVKQSGFMVQ